MSVGGYLISVVFPPPRKSGSGNCSLILKSNALVTTGVHSCCNHVPARYAVKTNSPGDLTNYDGKNSSMSNLQ